MLDMIYGAHLLLLPFRSVLTSRPILFVGNHNTWMVSCYSFRPRSYTMHTQSYTLEARTQRQWSVFRLILWSGYGGLLLF